MSEKAWYSAAAAAGIWGVSQATVYRYAESLGGVKVGRQWRFPNAAIVSTWDWQQKAHEAAVISDDDEILAEILAEAVA